MRIACALLACVAGCAELEYGTAESDVIGGHATPEGKFPGVGAVMTGATLQGVMVWQHTCTGTLIAPDAVLTAAHCVDPALVGSDVTWGFTLARDTTVGPLTIVRARATFKHEQFDLPGAMQYGFRTTNDIGIILLEQPITDVEPWPLPRPRDTAELVPALDMKIAGYGVTEQSSDGGILFDAETKLVSLTDTELQVGMGNPQPQNCSGDSGGPGFALVGGEQRVIGVVSRSFASISCTTGGVHERVDAYLPFIHGKVASGIPCDSGLAEACPPPDDDDIGGCCSSSQGAGGCGLLSLLVGVGLVRRRRGWDAHPRCRCRRAGHREQRVSSGNGGTIG